MNMEFSADTISAAGSLLAVAISIAALWFSRQMQIRVRTQESAADALAGFANLEQMIKDVPGALRFHGITETELQVANLSAGELSYFISNITTGGIYYRTSEEKDLIQFFNKTGYYGEMFRYQDTRNAWAICRVCLAPSAYRDKLDSLSQEYGGPTTVLAAHLAEKHTARFAVEDDASNQTAC